MRTGIFMNIVIIKLQNGGFVIKSV